MACANILLLLQNDVIHCPSIWNHTNGYCLLIDSFINLNLDGIDFKIVSCWVSFFLSEKLSTFTNIR